MSTLLLDRRGLALKREGNTLALYLEGRRHGSVPLHLVERLVLRSSVTLDSALLAHLADAGIGTLVFGGRRGRKQAIVLGTAHNEAARRIGQYRRYDDRPWRSVWSRRLVRHKLRRQLHLLRRATGERPDLRKPLVDAVGRLQQALDKLGPGQNADIEHWRGIEGAAAAAYFRAYTHLFAPALSFRGRNRRPPRDPVNAALSLGYTLLHFEAVNAAHAAGLDPLIGFYHELAFGRESLASDLIEPLRPRVDAWVWRQFSSRRLRVDDFVYDGEACLLGKSGRKDFFAGFECFVRPLRRLLRRFCTRLAARLAQDGHHRENTVC
jgi:CRISPR-associated protein Cas1